MIHAGKQTSSRSRGTATSAAWIGLLFVVAIAVACDAGILNPDEQLTPDTIIIARSAKVYDAAGVWLGYGTTSAWSIQMTSPTGWYYTLGWDGELVDSVCYFTEAGGGGVPFQNWVGNAPIGKAAFRVGGSIYRFSSVDAYGLAVPDTTIIAYSSFYANGTTADYGSPVSLGASQRAYPLIATTRTSFGIPAAIAIPLVVDHGD
ncbi:MAG: hypothetical protein KBC36_10980 [Spirochaetia bacterium]|nr:hypothetical protein [Spirochaetia bacterium]